MAPPLSPGPPGILVESFTLGLLQANCYLIADPTRARAVVVDPGQGALGPISARLDALGVSCQAVLATHGHLDHIAGAQDVARAYDAPIWLPAEDVYLFDDPAAAFGAQGAGFMAQLGIAWEPDRTLLETFTDGQKFAVGGGGLEARHTPGHTPGSSVFLLSGLSGTDQEQPLLSGDLLFAGSVGRTDFPRGSAQELQRSLARVVLSLPDATPVLPGHGLATTVGLERRTNPYLADLR